MSDFNADKIMNRIDDLDLIAKYDDDDLDIVKIFRYDDGSLVGWDDRDEVKQVAASVLDAVRDLDVVVRVNGIFGSDQLKIVVKSSEQDIEDRELAKNVGSGMNDVISEELE